MRIDGLLARTKTMSEPAPLATDGAAARLRDDIDRGRTGDKVDWPDPAVAPLGTDDEAGGSCAPGEIVEQTRRVEIARSHSPPQCHRRLGAAWLLISFVLVAASAIVLFLRRLQ
jgi:hypothetical protein